MNCPKGVAADLVCVLQSGGYPRKNFEASDGSKPFAEAGLQGKEMLNVTAK